MIKFFVFADDDTRIAEFSDEQKAWEFANQFTADNYAEDGCAYVEKRNICELELT
jgi:hypothetical protein